MMNFFNKKDNGYIILKDGYNKPFIFGTILILCILCFFVSTKFWLPDGRDRMTLNTKNEMSFKDTIVTLNEGYYWNGETNVAQITFKEVCIAESNDKIEFDIKTDAGNEMPMSLIKGKAIPEEEDSMVLITDYILQFGMPSDTYYLKFKITKGGISYDFIIDYRDFEKKDIKELDNNYLVEKQALNNENETFKAQKKALEDELANINKMSEEEKKAKETRVTEINQAIVKIDNDIKVNMHKFEVLEEGI